MRPAAILAVLLLAPGIQASQADPEWADADRDVDATHTSDLFQATSRARAPSTDTISIQSTPDQGVLRYALADPEGPAAAALDIEVVAIVEWRDDGDGRYGPRDDVVRRIEVQDLDPTMSVTPVDDGYQVETTYTIVASTSDEDPLGGGRLPAGRLIIGFYVLASPTDIDGQSVPPVDVPLRIAVEDFPYEAEDTRLAFEIDVGTDLSLATDGSEPIHVDEDPYRLHYSWAPQASADGAPVDTSATQIVRSPQIDASAATIYFAFPRGSDVAQGTTVGATRFTPEGVVSVPTVAVAGDTAVFTVAALGAVAAVGVPAWVRLRGGRP